MSPVLMSRVLGMPKRGKHLIALAAAAVIPQVLAVTKSQAATVNILNASVGYYGSWLALDCSWDTVGLSNVGPYSAGCYMNFYVCENSTTGPFTYFAWTSNLGSISGAILPSQNTGTTYEFYCEDNDAIDSSNIFGIYVP